MKKIRLDLEALAVETFEALPAAAGPKRGTVEGFAYSDECAGICDPLTGCIGACNGVITDVHYGSCIVTCAFTLE